MSCHLLATPQCVCLARNVCLTYLTENSAEQREHLAFCLPICDGICPPHQTWNYKPENYKSSLKRLGSLFKIYFIYVQLIYYNAVLIFTIQQSDSFIHIYTFFFIFFSIMVYHRILNMAPCARGTLLSSHSLYNSLHLLILNSQSTLPPPSPHLLGNYSPVLYVCESVSITQISHSCHILDSTYK